MNKEKKTLKERFNDAKTKTKMWFDEHGEALAKTVMILIGGAGVGLIGFGLGQEDGVTKENDRWCDALSSEGDTLVNMRKSGSFTIQTYRVHSEKIGERLWGEEPSEEAGE